MDTHELKQAIGRVAPITEDDWQLLRPDLTSRSIRKGDFFNTQGTVCKSLGYSVRGSFRAYYLVGEKEINVGFFFEKNFVVAYQSFVTQQPCPMFVEALQDTELILISYQKLQALYRLSHRWEHFGRMVAETAFVFSQKRVEGFLFETPEERYLTMLREYPDIHARVPLYHIASYIGIEGPSLSRIRRRLAKRKPTPETNAEPSPGLLT